MKQLTAIALALMMFGASPALAKHHYHHRHHHTYISVSNRPMGPLVTIHTAANPITVAADVAERFRGLVADLVAAGFHGPVHCYASGGHIRHSLHYSGRACDFAQRGWGRTVPIMYRAGPIIARWGFRDGCTFRHPDCGHVDTGPTHYARN